MQKTLFSKYFSITSALILLSITTLGAVFLLFASQYFQDDKFNLLDRNARQAANLTEADFLSNDYGFVSPSILLSGYTILGNSISADIFLVDAVGKTILCTDQKTCSHSQTTIPAETLKLIDKNGYHQVDKLFGIYENPHYVVGIPIYSKAGTMVGVVFAGSSAESLNAFLMEILKMFAISAITVMMFSFGIIYLITSRLVRPLRDMVFATQTFSKGDFSTRVPIESTDEIGQLAKAFNNMASSLSQLEAVRRSFTANVSHELRTPMTTIAGFIDGILDGTIEKEKHDHYLKIVSEEIKRLSRLVRSMLNIARIEAGELEIKPELFDFNDTIMRTVFTFEKAIEDKHLEVRGLDHQKVMVQADPDLMHQVVYNLIENAVKFASEDGYIAFTYTEDDDYNYIGVKNSGMGIAKAELPNVFDRFYKVDKSRSIHKGGAGLGLYIVRTIVNLHKGEIIVRSVEGEYCEFVFTIPKVKQIAPKSKKNSPAKI